MIKRKNIRFIPSQRIKGSDKELFIINYEGSAFEIQRTSNLYEPLIIRLNGELLDTIPSKQNKEIEFSTPAGKHKIQVWNERVENNLIPKIFVKDGIAAVIDGIPVQNTLADPITRFKTGQTFIWLLTALLFLKAFIIPLTSQQLSLEGETRVFLFVNIILFVLSLSAALTFQLNPLRSVWIALVVSVLEFASYVLAVIALKEIDIVVILFTVLRLAILASLIFSLRNLKLILNFSDDEYQVTAEKPSIQKKVKKISFPKKYVTISLITLAILIGGYLAITEIIKSSKSPSLERDSSLEFRTDLNLPDLIPYRKGNKWGYCNIGKEIVLQPIYDEARIPTKNSNRLIVKFNGKYGVINRRGEKIIQFRYDEIGYSGNRFIVRFNNYEGLLGYNGEFLTPIKYEHIYKSFGNNYIARIESGSNLGILFGIIDSLGQNLTEFNFLYLDIINDSIAVGNRFKNYIKNKYGLGWDSWDVIRGLIKSDDLIFKPYDYEGAYIYEGGVFNLYTPKYCRFSRQRKDLNYKGNRFQPSSYFGVINMKGSQIIPPIYSGIDVDTNYNYFIVDIEDKKGVIDSMNNIVVPIRYDNIKLYKTYNNDILYLCEMAGYKGILNKDGEVVIPFEYTELIGEHNELTNQDIVDTLIAEKEINYNKKFGLINLKNEIVSDFIYEDVLAFLNGHIIVELNKKWGVINKKGDVVIAIQYDDINEYPFPIYDLFEIEVEDTAGYRIASGYVDLNGVEYFEED